MKKLLLLLCLCLLAPGLVSAERRAYQKDTFKGQRASLSLTPLELGAAAWWDASLSAITTSGGKVTGVTDLSGNGYALSTMEDWEPTLGVADAGFPAFITDGGQMLVATVAELSQPWSVLFVGKVSALPGVEETAVFIADASYRGLSFDSDAYYVATGIDITGGTPGAGSYVVAGVAGVEVEETNSGYLYLNGALIASGEAGEDAIGTVPVLGHELNGSIFAGATFAKALTASEIAGLSVYFKRRWRF